MASGSSANDPATLKNALYDACLPLAEGNPKHVFNQKYLEDLRIVPGTVQDLANIIQLLLDEHLFILTNSSDGAGWRLRSKDEARKYKGLRHEFAIVYNLIDEAGSEGIWTKTIKARCNLHDALFRQAIKHLESKHLISDMKSVEHPTRKMYIKSTLRPSERATGGPWYTDGELDTAFIQQMMDVCHSYILKKSFYYGKSATKKREKEPRKSKSKMTPEEIKALRDKTLGSRIKTESVADKRKADYDRMLPMPADYKEYPTCDELTEYIDSSGISQTILTAADVQQLLDIMCFDEKVERVDRGDGEYAYRTLRKSIRHEDDRPQNLLTEAPCGRCPVFDLCEEGGPVGPSNCEYFTDWLTL